MDMFGEIETIPDDQIEEVHISSEWKLSVNLYLTDTHGYVAILTYPNGDKVARRGHKLPEPMQNAIPVYLPMILADPNG